MLKRTLKDVTPANFKGVLVHMWDSLTVGVKCALFIPQGNDPTQWKDRPSVIDYFSDEQLNHEGYAYLQGKAAQVFLAQREMYIVDKTKQLAEMNPSLAATIVKRNRRIL